MNKLIEAFKNNRVTVIKKSALAVGSMVAVALITYSVKPAVQLDEVVEVVETPTEEA